MVTARAAYLALVAAVALERAAELVVSARHARRLLAAGGAEAGREHYPLMVVFHAAWLVACAAGALAPPPPPAGAAAAAAGVLAAQALRRWAVAALGPRWTTRVITLPGAPRLARGPYRWLRHPNYLAVAVEVACLPLAWGLWPEAVLASAANGLLLATRVRVEERALAAAGAAPDAGAEAAPLRSAEQAP